ncbi:MAG: hypothetical protein QNJ97_02370 [Myxococcota bacterium]|nr:hypothetical protein [Myxococcota bacterium]
MSYTVEQALHLYKNLPIDEMSPDLFNTVVKVSLDSAGVSISELKEMAEQKQDNITEAIMGLQGEISAVEEAATEKKEQIVQLQNEVSSLEEAAAEKKKQVADNQGKLEDIAQLIGLFEE